MPLMSVFISFGVPAALGVYWIFKSILGVLKQLALYYIMPLPKFTEDDYRAAEKEIGSRPEKASVQKSGRVVRSLHRIDDEDFEDTAEAARKHKEALAAQEAADAESKKQDAVYHQLKKHLTQFFQTPVQLTCSAKGSGKISIKFKDEQELERIISIFDKLNR